MCLLLFFSFFLSVCFCPELLRTTANCLFACIRNARSRTGKEGQMHHMVWWLGLQPAGKPISLCWPPPLPEVPGCSCRKATCRGVCVMLGGQAGTPGRSCSHYLPVACLQGGQGLSDAWTAHMFIREPRPLLSGAGNALLFPLTDLSHRGLLLLSFSI